MTEVRKPLIAANWKMYKGPRETRDFVGRLAGLYPPRTDRTIVFFPPAISIPAFLVATVGRPDLRVGVQDVHTDLEGAHTGAISARMAAEVGVGWGLAGHSERRNEFGDDDAHVAGKLRRLLDAGLKPVLCVGETLEERTAGRLEEVLRRQIKAVLGGLGGRTWSPPVLAYEPVWAIGTGETASPADASEAHAIVREVLLEAPGDAARAVVLYGGSVKPDNIDALLGARGVDGVLVGGASLEPASFARICLGGTGDGRFDPQLL